MPTRRQFLHYTAALATASAFSLATHRYLNHPPSVHINRVGLPFGHLLRDNSLPMQAKREYHTDILVLGSGAAALSAVWYLAKHGRRNILLAEGIERNGNNAGYTFSDGIRTLTAPTGAHYLALPSKESSHLQEMLRDLGIMFTDGTFNETDLVHAPESRLWFQNQWQEHLLPKLDSDSQRFFNLINQLKTAYGTDNRKIFAMPIALSSHDKSYRQLDNLTFEQWLNRENYQSSTLRWYLDYCCRDDYGQGIAQVSAFAGLHYFCARNSEDTVLTWANGLAHLSEKLRHHAQIETLTNMPSENHITRHHPAAINASALSIEEFSDGIQAILQHNDTGEVFTVFAQHLICAMPLMVAQRIITNAQQYGFTQTNDYAPWLVSNFVLHQFPKEHDHNELAWDNVIYNSPHLGYVVATHQQISVAKPEYTIFTAYTALHHDTPQNIRQWLLNASESELLDYVAEDLVNVYGKTFWQHVNHVDITVRAHAMSVPKIGYLNNPMLLKLRQHQSRLLFAHSDLSGYSVFEEASFWGVEAAKKILNAV